jgi:hypothetical protein
MKYDGGKVQGGELWSIAGGNPCDWMVSKSWLIDRLGLRKYVISDTWT